MSDDTEPFAPEPLAVTLKMTQRMLSLSKTKVNQLANSGDLERLHVGKRTLITVTSIKRFLAQLAN